MGGWVGGCLQTQPPPPPPHKQWPMRASAVGGASVAPNVHGAKGAEENCSPSTTSSLWNPRLWILPHSLPPPPQGDFGGRPGQRVEEQGAWASPTRKRSEARCGRLEDGGVWTAKTVKRPRQQPAQPPVCQRLGTADAQTAHPATFSTAPAHQPLGSANAETTPARAAAAAADRTQRPDATCEGKSG